MKNILIFIGLFFTVSSYAQKLGTGIGFGGGGGDPTAEISDSLQANRDRDDALYKQASDSVNSDGYITNNRVELDSITSEGADAKFFNGGDTVPGYVPYEDRINIIDVAVVSNSAKAMKDFGSTIKSFPVIPPGGYISSGLTLTDGRVYYCLHRIDSTTPLTGCMIEISTQGDYTNDNFNGVALYKVNGTDVDSVACSANNGTFLEGAAFSTQSVPFADPYVAEAGYYYAAILYNESANVTVPAVYGYSAISMLNTAFGDNKKLVGYNASETTFVNQLAFANILDVSPTVLILLY